ncbi:MAG: hypothetical protein KGJ49_04660 [Alphaproteobacteria bacterium]|nr:hypothetical protein [Alphaproteobacteria bacterium]
MAHFQVLMICTCTDVVAVVYYRWPGGHVMSNNLERTFPTVAIAIGALVFFVSGFLAYPIAERSSWIGQVLAFVNLSAVSFGFFFWALLCGEDFTDYFRTFLPSWAVFVILYSLQVCGVVIAWAIFSGKPHAIDHVIEIAQSYLRWNYCDLYLYGTSDDFAKHVIGDPKQEMDSFEEFVSFFLGAIVNFIPAMINLIIVKAFYFRDVYLVAYVAITSYWYGVFRVIVKIARNYSP